LLKQLSLRKRSKHSRRVAEFRKVSGLHHLAADEHDDAICSVEDVGRFAVEKANTILNNERKRLVQLSDRCSRSQPAFGKTQQALQFIDPTSNLPSSIQARL
jgi:hypothetical protein